MNQLYRKYDEEFIKGTAPDLTSVNVKVALIDTAVYGPSGSTVANFATDQFVSTLASAILSRSGNLASKSVTGGVFNAANATFAAVTAGHTGGALVIFYDTGSDATSQLMVWLDTASGLPVTTTGADVSINWDTGSNKIFKL